MSAIPATSMHLPPLARLTRLATRAAILPCLAAGVMAADPVQSKFEDQAFLLTVGAGSPPTLDVEEDVGGQHWDWHGEGHTPLSLTIEGAWTSIGKRGGPFIGVDLTLARHDITPRSYGYAGQEFTNTSQSRLTCTMLGGDAFAGWQYGMTGDYSRDVQVVGTLVAFAGGGYALAATDSREGGAYSRGKGSGGYYDYGARAGLSIIEGRVVAGVTAAYVWTKAKVTVDVPGGRTSKLTLEGDGFQFGGQFGYSF